jgi:hypothetical protein
MITKDLLCIVLLILAGSNHVTGQKILNATGSCQLRIESSMSLDNAKKEALACAQKDALSKAFGTKIIQEDIMRSSTQSNGQQIKGATSYQSIGKSELGGEWLETTGTDFKRQTNDAGDEFLTCVVSGKVRELKRKAVSFQSFPVFMAGDKTTRTEEFNNDQHFYLYFKAPRNGHVSIYLDDGKNTFQLLPYKTSDQVCFPVNADQEYYFFSRNHPTVQIPLQTNTKIDEMQLTTDAELERNSVYIIFSSENIDKPLLESDNGMLSGTDRIQGYTVPKYTPTEKFIEHLQQLRKANGNIEVLKIGISIINKK